MVLPVSVESPISVSRLSEDGDTSTSDKLLESDIVELSLSKDFVLVCQAGLAAHRTQGPALILGGGRRRGSVRFLCQISGVSVVSKMTGLGPHFD